MAKTANRPRLTILTRITMDSRLIIRHMTKPINICIGGIDRVSLPKSFSFSTDAPSITGMANRKANFMAAWRSQPLNKPVAMVNPERDSPGRMAKVWAIPTQNACNIVALSNGFGVLLQCNSDKIR